MTLANVKGEYKLAYDSDSDIYAVNSFISKFSKAVSNVIGDSIIYDSFDTNAQLINSSKFVDDQTTVDFLNGNLQNKLATLPPGKYAPWYINAKGKADINLDASESEWHTIP